MAKVGWFHVLLAGLTGCVLVAAVAAAAAGVPMTVCLLIATLAPVVTVVGFEIVGHRHASRGDGQQVDEGHVTAAAEIEGLQQLAFVAPLRSAAAGAPCAG